jgi:hypothetical protein
VDRLGPRSFEEDQTVCRRNAHGGGREEISMTSKSATPAFACLVGAIAWPWLVSASANLLMSPIERATQSAWCGMPLHSGFVLLGHCAPCWTGSALLAATSALLLLRAHDVNSAERPVRAPIRRRHLA